MGKNKAKNIEIKKRNAQNSANRIDIEVRKKLELAINIEVKKRNAQHIANRIDLEGRNTLELEKSPNKSFENKEKNLSNNATASTSNEIKPVESHATVLSNYAKSGFVVLNQSNAINPFGKERLLLSNGNLWHKIFITNAESSDREFVLKTIIEAVYPLDLIPVSYKLQGTVANFIARNCGPAIEKLSRQNFIVQNPKMAKSPFVLQVVLASSNTSETQLNVQDNITATLTKRYNTNTKVLNLELFHKDQYLSDLIFCILSQPKILYFVLHLTKSIPMHSLKLNSNELRNLAPLEVLSNCKTLQSLDLRNNLINNISALSTLKALSITELWLDGNPVCENYLNNDQAYIQAVKGVCPALEKLDGVMLGQNGFPAFRRNYLVDNKFQELIDQFLEHFFTLYDTNDRKCLDGLYHKDAMFSLTCNYIPNQITSASAKLIDYKAFARNIMTLSDLSKGASLLCCGAANIVNRLCSLPITEHDPYTFAVDCVHSTDSLIVLIVHGVFRETPETLLELDRILGFSRTFILKAGAKGEWNIVNDLLHVANATTVMAQKAFKIVKNTKSFRFDNTTILEAKTAEEREHLIFAFKQISSLNVEWTKRCLEESKWNFEKALTLFVDLYKVDRIPLTAFEGNVTETEPASLQKNTTAPGVESSGTCFNNGRSSARQHINLINISNRSKNFHYNQ